MRTWISFRMSLDFNNNVGKFHPCFHLLLQTCCAGKPYLATHDAAAPELATANVAPSAGAAAADWLFQPIAEDESGFDEETLEAIISGGGGTEAAGEGGTNKV